MPGSSTVVVAREDLSIPGADEEKRPTPIEASAVERQFFELVRDSRPDVVVLDLSNTKGDGIEAILKIRQRCAVPILVVCAAHDPRTGDYRIAGAAECMTSPVDIILLNQMILRIKRVTRPENAKTARHQEAVAFAGIVFRPEKNLLSAMSGPSVRLTTAEIDLLSMLVSRPWTICSRAEIGEILYGRHRPKSDRAIDVIVARLRKKLAALIGPNAEELVQTKHRWGYMLAADVSAMPQPDGTKGRPLGARDGELHPISLVGASAI
jgi:two-component system, OmpR family, response regulator